MPSITRRVRQDGTVVYRVRVRVKGHPAISNTLGSKAAARRWGEGVEADLRARRLQPLIEAERHTLSEAIERYDPSALTPRSAAMRESQLRWWGKELGSHSLAELTPAAISAARDRLLRRVSPATSNRYLAALSSVLSVAVREWQWIDANPCRNIRRKRESRGRVRFLSDDERKALLEACRESQEPRLYPLVLTALASGARRGELMRLTWGDVDLANSRAVLHKTKNRERRVIGLSGAVVALRDMPRQISGPVFGAHFPRKAWEAALESSKVEGFRFHDLRHTAASYLAMSGASLAELAAFLGHKTLAMVARYAHLTDSHAADVQRKMAERFLT